MRRRTELLRSLPRRLALSWLLGATLGCAAAPPDCDRAQFAVAVDTGHTPARPGATSARGEPEYRFNRQLARRVLTELRQRGFTRSFDTNPQRAEIELLERSAVAQRHGASLLLSIHHDSAQPQLLSRWSHAGRSLLFNDAIAGYSLFVSERNGDPPGSRRFAQLLANRLRASCLRPSLHHAEPIAGESRDLLDPSLGIYRFDGLAVLRSASMPAVLIEAGVIINRDEELLLRGSQRQHSVASAIADAVLDFCAAADAPPPAPATSACRSAGARN